MDQKKKQTLIELVAYLFFGVLTTVVSMVTYFAVLWLGEIAFNIAPDDTRFYAIRIVAQILQWVFAVLFAFYTNKKWVFKAADRTTSTMKQLIAFSGSRLLTLGIDTLVTFGTVELLYAFNYNETVLHFIIDITISADLISKVAASVIVVISNYVLSKLFVFRSKKENS